MLSYIQREILQTLINLYQTSNGKSIKSKDIAEAMNRNSGTIRNQMQSLRSLSLIKGFSGPSGGYKPTIKAYYNLNISCDNDFKVPIYQEGNRVEGVSVINIEFTNVPNHAKCETSIKVLGNIKNLNLGDKIKIGPTPVNSLGIIGEIIGRDDIDNILLLDTTTVRSIPKKKIKNIASLDLLFLEPNDTIKEAAKFFSKKNIDGVPVIENNEIRGILTLNDIVQFLAESKEDLKVKDAMQKNVVTVNHDMNVGNAVEFMHNENIGRLILVDGDKPVGIVTKTDLVNSITRLKDFPFIKANK